MTEFVTGRARADKTAEIFRRINGSEDGRETLLIVPDQFSFDTEIAIYRNVEKTKLLNVSVTTFSKLAEKIIALYSAKKDYADDIVKKLIMFRTLKNLKGSLDYYERHIEKPQFPSFMLDVVASLKSGGITPRDLRRLVEDDEEMKQSLSSKLSDIYQIYDGYNEELEKTFADRLDDIMKAVVLAEENDFFKGKNVYFDSFESFSGNQLAFVKTVMETAAECVITLTTDFEDSSEQCFFAANKLIARLSGYGGKSKVTSVPETRSEPSARLIVEAPDVQSECRWTAAEINRLAAEEGYRYKEIAVLCGSEEYPRELESMFRKYNVPAFIDIPQSIAEKPIARFVLFILDALSFETESILRYIKTNLVYVDGADKDGNPKRVRLSRRKINDIERFARKWNISPREWTKPFPKRNETRFVEELRKGIVTPLAELKERIDGQTGDVITRELCSFLMDEDKMNITSSIYGLCKSNREESTDKLIFDKEKVDEYRQLWEAIVSVLQSVYVGLEGYRVSLDDYRKLLGEIFAETTVAKPPQFIDTVTVGDLERTRTAAPKVVFICGANEGNIPAAAKPKGAFSVHETEYLISKSLPVGKDRTDRFSEQQLYAYKALESPSERLYLSYPLSDPDGKAMERSRILDGVKAETVFARDYGAEFYCRTAESAKDRLAEIYGGGAGAELAAIVKAVNDSEYLKTLALAEQRYGAKGYEHTVTDSGKLKYLPRRTYSPSALETLGSCRYSYFCKYVLGLNDDTEKDINAAEKGNIIHFIMENVLKYYRDNPDEFPDAVPENEITEEYSAAVKAIPEKISALCAEYGARYREENMLGQFGFDKRYEVLFDGIVKTAERLAARTVSDFRHSRFKPAEFEKTVEFDIPKNAPEDGDILIKGKLDRLDVLKDGEREYCRVADYKTGKTRMNISNLAYGRNVQMLLYLNAVCGGERIPSALFYCPSGEGGIVSKDSAFDGGAIDIGGIECSNEEKEKLMSVYGGMADRVRKTDDAKNWLEEHTMSGIEINNGADGAADPAYDDFARMKSLYSAETGKKVDSTVDAEEFSREEYAKVLDYVEKEIRRSIDEVNSGKISAEPHTFDKNKDDVCKYCNFKPFCGNGGGHIPMDKDKDYIDRISGRAKRLEEEKPAKRAKKAKESK